MRATVYTKEACQPCKATKRHLTRLGAVWTEVPLTAEKAEQFRSQGLLQAPVVEAYSLEFGTLVEVWTGYDPDKIDDHFKA